MNAGNPEGPRTAGPSTARVEAFSDGVFAIAITLLVLEIRVPEGNEGQLWRELLDIWPSYAAYAISFLTIGVMWLHHHHLMMFLATVSRGLLYRNLALLAVVGFLPFPTALLARFATGHSGADQRAAVAAYGLTMITLSIAFTLLWDGVQRSHQLRTADADPAAIRTSRNRSIMAILWYGVATAIAVLTPLVSLAVFALMTAAFALAGPQTQETDTAPDSTPPAAPTGSDDRSRGGESGVADAGR
ncbi:MAG: TMEM175 family protein [Mycobacteriaceae bacterium]